MKFDACKQFVTLLVVGWDLVSGAVMGSIYGKRAVEIVVPKRSEVIKSPHWKVVYGVDDEVRRDDVFPDRTLSRRVEKIPSRGYPDSPGYVVIKKADVWPRQAEYVDGLSENGDYYPLYESGFEELANRPEKRVPGRVRKYYEYYK